MKPATFRAILPVDGAQLFQRRVPDHAGHLLPRCTLADAIPGAKHQAEAVDAIGREALPARPGAGRLRRQPAVPSLQALQAFRKMGVERNEDSRFERPVAVWEPQAMDAVAVPELEMEA